MRVSHLQYTPTYLNTEANLARVETLIEGISTDLLVLPELFQTGYFFKSAEDLQSVAEPIPDGPTTERLQTWASDTGAVIVAGLAEQEGDDIFNSSVLVRPTGETETYRKVHLFYEETTLFTPGDLGFPVFDVETREGHPYRLGMMVCFE